MNKNNRRELLKTRYFSFLHFKEVRSDLRIEINQKLKDPHFLTRIIHQETPILPIKNITRASIK